MTVCLGVAEPKGSPENDLEGPASLKRHCVNFPLPGILGTQQTCNGSSPPRPQLQSTATPCRRGWVNAVDQGSPRQHPSSLYLWIRGRCRGPGHGEEEVLPRWLPSLLSPPLPDKDALLAGLGGEGIGRPTRGDVCKCFFVLTGQSGRPAPDGGPVRGSRPWAGLQPQQCPGRRGRDPPTDSYISNVQRTDASRIQALWGQFSCTQMVRRPVICSLSVSKVGTKMKKQKIHLLIRLHRERAGQRQGCPVAPREGRARISSAAQGLRPPDSRVPGASVGPTRYGDPLTSLLLSCRRMAWPQPIGQNLDPQSGGVAAPEQEADVWDAPWGSHSSPPTVKSCVFMQNEALYSLFF